MNWKFAGFALLAGIAPAVLAFSGSDSYALISGAGVLPHNSYQVFSQMQLHRTPDLSFPWTTGARLGLFGHGELGLEFGKSLSLSTKVNLIQQEEWRPTWTVGVRQLFASQEAHLQSVPDSLQKDFTGEAYTVLSHRFSNGTRIDAGASVLPLLDSGSSQYFWGLQQDLGEHLAVVYDGFWRRATHHHNLGLAFQWNQVFRLSAGATEVHRFFQQNDEFGLYFSDREHRTLDGYSAPGFWAQISLTGWMGESKPQGLEARLQQQEASREKQLKRIDSLEVQLDRLQMLVEAQAPRGGDSLNRLTDQAESMLEELVKGLHNEAWDPAESRRLQDSLINMGEVAKKLLQRMVLRESSNPEYRIAAVRIMGTSKDAFYISILSEYLKSSQSVLVRECLYSLARIGTPEAFERIRSVRLDLSAELRELADGLLEKP